MTRFQGETNDALQGVIDAMMTVQTLLMRAMVVDGGVDGQRLIDGLRHLEGVPVINPSDVFVRSVVAAHAASLEAFIAGDPDTPPPALSVIDGGKRD